jgi:serine protease Do
MSTRRTTWFYGTLLVMASIAIGLVIASRLDLTPPSAAQGMAPPPMNSSPVTGALDAQTFRNIAKAQSPMVVNIRTTATKRTQEMTEFFGDDLFRRFFGQPGQPGQGQGGQGDGSTPPQGQQPQRRRQPQQPEETYGAGTGFIIDKSGLILTNNHVVENATKITVEIFGEDEGSEFNARVVGRDPLSDSALIELTEKPSRALPEAKFGDSEQMQPGDWVMAIGNPFGLDHTVTVGVISALGRRFDVMPQRSVYMLQTDAAINPGNSGGPLLNLRGEVVGINTAILSDRASNLGIGFAVPINIVRELLPQLRTGKITRGMIGVQIQGTPISSAQAEALGLKERKGAVVSLVAPNGPAAKGGLEPGDVVTEFNGRPVPNDRALVDMVVATKPGTTVPLKVIRDGAAKSINVTVAELELDSDASEEPETENDVAKGFGLALDDITPALARRLRLPANTAGALVTEVRPRSAAGRAGVQEGDVLTRLGRAEVASAADANKELQRIQVGQAIGVRLYRDGQEMFFTMRKE